MQPAANTATVTGIETITGGVGADAITMGAALTVAMSVNLGTGASQLTLANFANTGTVSGAQSVIGGTGADTVTLGAAMSNGSVDLGSWSDAINVRQLQRVCATSSVMSIPSPAAPATTPSHWRRHCPPPCMSISGPAATC